MNVYKIIRTSGIALAIALSMNSCKKDYLDTKPSTQVPLEDVFKTTAGAKTVLNGMHRRLYTSDDHDKFGLPSININYDLMGEDFGNSEAGLGWFNRAYSDAQNGDSYPWNIYYAIITNANFILKNIDAAVGSEEERNEVKGQAYAYRGWAYLQLLQTYQMPYGGLGYVVDGGTGSGYGVYAKGTTPSDALGVPLYTEPTKEAKPRASMRDVLTQIDSDLDASIENFKKGSLGRGADKSQINLNVAYGIKARSALYQRKWTVAANLADSARQGWTLSSGNTLLDGFNSTSAGEWMWGAHINQEQNGIYGSFYSHLDPKLGGYADYDEKVVGSPLIRKMGGVDYSQDLDSNDVRFHWWNPSSRTRWPGYEHLKFKSQLKFRTISDASFAGDYPYMRVAEMYLIEAEGKALANDLTGAATILEEFVKTRQPNYDVSAYNTKDLLVHEIWRQRRIELWGEGFRFFDAKRQMVQSTGVVPLSDINRQPSGFYLGSEPIVVSPYTNYMYYLIPGNEITNNNACLQNPPKIK
ncbi:MAG TPA: RagB/SusD family nutrient uptake outer membrane protein [Edaphocola sp.]|nr:RagB/SusD family nutrient uptake outer membrane protein [Edaphocola sp.]